MEDKEKGYVANEENSKLIEKVLARHRGRFNRPNRVQ